jgi:hypothetical protein
MIAQDSDSFSYLLKGERQTSRSSHIFDVFEPGTAIPVARVPDCTKGEVDAAAPGNPTCGRISQRFIAAITEPVAIYL